MLNFNDKQYNMADWPDSVKELFQDFLAISAMRERHNDVLQKAHEDMNAAALAHKHMLIKLEVALSSMPSTDIPETEEEEQND